MPYSLLDATILLFLQKILLANPGRQKICYNWKFSALNILVRQHRIVFFLRLRALKRKMYVGRLYVGQTEIRKLNTDELFFQLVHIYSGQPELQKSCLHPYQK